MGNCQAVDAAALVIQHPCGKLERMYWPVTANEVMKTNPGHYVSLIIPLQPADSGGGGERLDSDNNRTVRFTRVKLLRPTDTLVLGRAYRLVTTQEVMKVLRAKKNAKMKNNQSQSQSQSGSMESAPDVNDQAILRSQRSREQRSLGPSVNSGAGRPKPWRPSLQSISEARSS